MASETDQLFVAISLAPAEATTLALAASQNVKEDQRLSKNVQPSESLSLTHLIGHFRLLINQLF
jgi:hypothetical protein